MRRHRFLAFLTGTTSTSSKQNAPVAASLKINQLCLGLGETSQTKEPPGGAAPGFVFFI
jgi:hypothetical protein